MNKLLVVMLGVVILAVGIWSIDRPEANEGAHYYKFADLQELTHPDIFKWRFSKREKMPEPTVTPTPKPVEEMPIRETKPAIWKPLPEKTVYFDYDKSLLKPEGKAAIQRNVQYLKEHPDARVLIEGHCDERGTNEYNLALGERRANTVKKYMADLGIATGRITTKSWGEERPVDPGHSESAWWKNRRGEMYFSEE